MTLEAAINLGEDYANSKVRRRFMMNDDRVWSFNEERPSLPAKGG